MSKLNDDNLGEDLFLALDTGRRLRPMALWIVRWDAQGKVTWRELLEEGELVRPYHLEIPMGKEPARDEHLERAFERVEKTGKPVKAELHGFHDWFWPVRSKTGQKTCLYAGQFRESSLDENELAALWRQLSGRRPSSVDADYVRFARSALNMPVLDKGPCQAMEAWMDHFAAYLEGEVPPALREKLVRLRQQALLPALLERRWVERAIGHDGFRPPPWYWDKAISTESSQELGITRVPNCVMGFIPVLAREQAADPVRSLLAVRAIQHEFGVFARSLPEAVGGALQDYGLLLLCSPTPGKDKSLQRDELRECAEAVRKWIRQRFGLRAVAGVGAPVALGERLLESHRQALLTLHTALQADRDLLFYEDQPAADRHGIHPARKALENLSRALEEGEGEHLRLAADLYVRQLLEYAGERIEVVRAQLLSGLADLGRLLRRVVPLAAPELERLEAGAEHQLEHAPSLPVMLDAFNEALRGLALFASRPSDVQAVRRLEDALAYLQENFQAPLRLAAVARRFGFSIPAFTRHFRRRTGTSFLDFLNRIRVDRARRLLGSTTLGLEHVGSRCGFSSPHHLIRVFKKTVGMTPASFRQTEQADRSEAKVKKPKLTKTAKRT